MKIQFSVLMLAAISAVGFLVYSQTANAQSTPGTAPYNCTTTQAAYGTMSKDIQVAKTGAYTVWTRMMKSGTNDKFVLQTNTNQCSEIKGTNLAENQWNWVSYKASSTNAPSVLDFKAGASQVKIHGIQPGVKIDRVMLVEEGTCPGGPVGNGDNCTAIVDTLAPSITFSSPVDKSTVSDRVNISASIKDDYSAAKAQIIIDGRLVADNLIANPQISYVWDSTSVQNGSHQITIVATDDSNNTSRSVRTVNVLNGDIDKPSTPTNLTAKTDSGKVILNWTNSTDNVGVASYSIYRSDSTVINTTTTATYIDSTVLQGKMYTYSVVAKDAAGNVSGRSNTVEIKVPQAQDTQAPTAPTNLRVNASSSTQVNLNWTASVDNVALAGYDVYRSTASDAFVKLANTTAVSFGDSGLQANTKYSYYIIAKDTNANVSVKSNTVSVTTPQKTTTPTTPGTDQPTTPVNQTGVIRGKITASSRKAIPGVRVTVTSRSKNYSAVTNNDGVYRLENIPAGQYSVSFTHSSYVTKNYTARVKQNQNVVINAQLTSKSTGSSPWWRWFWR